MKKNKSQKLLTWDTKDFALNITVCVINVIILIALFIGMVYLNLENGALKQSFRDYFNEVSYPVQYIFALVLIVAVMEFYMYFEERNFFKDALNTEMVFAIIEISMVICFLIGKYVNNYFRPLALVAVLTMFLSNRKTAIFVQSIFCIMMLLIDFFISPAGTVIDYEAYFSLIVGFSSGIIVIYVLEKVASRFILLLRSFYAAIPTLICVIIPIVRYDSVDIKSSVINIVCATLSGPFAISIFMILLPFFEILFNKITNFKLAELTDHKSKLIKRLIKEAPGTFNHAIVVSNIAEACATAIGEDALLARTCAYYHDIGKLRRPEFFGENQVDGKNPHDDLTPELSTNIIKSHTVDGYKLAVKNGIPKIIANTCIEHHGTMPILYFYDKAKKITDGEVDIKQYCYLGPKPQSKISAIIMIADGCEAVSRTLKSRSREEVTLSVRKIVNERMALGQFDDCEITLKELNIIVNTVVNNLSGIYHSRVEYPKVDLDGLDLEDQKVKSSKAEEQKNKDKE